MRHTEMKTCWIRLVLLCSMVLCALLGFGQVQTGLPALGSFQQVGPLTINLANLNAHLSIPIVSKAGRGIPFNYALTYDNSAVWMGGQQWVPADSNCAAWDAPAGPCVKSSAWGWQPQGTGT